MQTKCTIGQLSDGDGHGLLLAESEEAFICFPAGKHTHRVLVLSLTVCIENMSVMKVCHLVEDDLR